MTISFDVGLQFIYIGATIPFDAWNDPDLTLKPWRLATLAICIILLRRFPAMLAAARWIKDIKTPREAVFCGHFGPIGVGAIFISTLAATKLPTPSIPPENSLDVLALTVQPVTYLLVLCSVLVHGLSIPFFSLGRSMHSRVHSMTRTWTQASNQEPSWLSRVKRAGDVITPVSTPPEREKEKDGSPSSTQIGQDDSKLEKGQLSSDDENRAAMDSPEKAPPESEDVVAPPQTGFPDFSAKQRELERQMMGEVDDEENEGDEEEEPAGKEEEAEAPEASGSGGSDPDAGQEPARDDSPNRLRPTVSIRDDADGGKRPMFPTRPSNFRLPTMTGTKRSREEEMARHKEKLARDAWCRRERRDNPKKNEERMYVSGRRIIIEHGAGDEVEIRDIDPSSEAARKAKADPKLGLIKISSRRLDTETEAVEREGGGVEGTTAAAYKAAKRLVQRRFSLGGGDSHYLPGPGLGPRAHDTPLEEDEDEEPPVEGKGKQRERREGKGRRSEDADLPFPSPSAREEQDGEGLRDRSTQKEGHETHYDDRCERKWIEGDKVSDFVPLSTDEADRPALGIDDHRTRKRRRRRGPTAEP